MKEELTEWQRWVVEAIRKIKVQKQRPSVERICHAIRQHQPFTDEVITDRLERLVDQGQILKVFNGGLYTYKDPVDGYKRKLTVTRDADITKSVIKAVREMRERESQGVALKALVKYLQQSNCLQMDSGVDLEVMVKNALRRCVERNIIILDKKLYRVAAPATPNTPKEKPAPAANAVRSPATPARPPATQARAAATPARSPASAVRAPATPARAPATPARTPAASVRTPASTRKSTPQTNTPIKAGIPICGECLGTAEKNRRGETEELVCCSSCGAGVHQSCLPTDVGTTLALLRSRGNSWRCDQCATCYVCDKPDQALGVVCGLCERCSHVECLRPSVDRRTKEPWICQACVEGQAPPVPEPSKQTPRQPSRHPNLRIAHLKSLRKAARASLVRRRGKLKEESEQSTSEDGNSSSPPPSPSSPGGRSTLPKEKLKFFRCSLTYRRQSRLYRDRERSEPPPAPSVISPVTPLTDFPRTVPPHPPLYADDSRLPFAGLASQTEPWGFAALKAEAVFKSKNPDHLTFSDTSSDTLSLSTKSADSKQANHKSSLSKSKSRKSRESIFSKHKESKHINSSNNCYVEGSCKNQREKNARLDVYEFDEDVDSEPKGLRDSIGASRLSRKVLASEERRKINKLSCLVGRSSRDKKKPPEEVKRPSPSSLVKSALNSKSHEYQRRKLMRDRELLRETGSHLPLQQDVMMTCPPPPGQPETVSLSSFVNSELPPGVTEKDLDIFKLARERAGQLTREQQTLPESMRASPKDKVLPPRCPAAIEFGQHLIKTWYSSPFPQEYARLSKLFLCEFCLKYTKSKVVLNRHLEKCSWRHPPGTEIYRESTLSVFEVDGNVAKFYCQNLCLLAKLFLDHKTLYYDVEPFLFYVLTVSDDKGFHLVGYFSKEKHCAQKYNVSCIMTLPQYQRKGYGRFLIDFSYLLSKEEGMPGTPEKPLSDLGRVSYLAYWRSIILEFLDGHRDEAVTLDYMTQETGLHTDDIIMSLREMKMLRYCKNKITLVVDWDEVDKHMVRVRNSKSRIKIVRESLRWTPLISTLPDVFNEKEEDDGEEESGDKVRRKKATESEYEEEEEEVKLGIGRAVAAAEAAATVRIMPPVKMPPSASASKKKRPGRKPKHSTTPATPITALEPSKLKKGVAEEGATPKQTTKRRRTLIEKEKPVAEETLDTTKRSRRSRVQTVVDQEKEQVEEEEKKIVKAVMETPTEGLKRSARKSKMQQKEKAASVEAVEEEEKPPLAEEVSRRKSVGKRKAATPVVVAEEETPLPRKRRRVTLVKKEEVEEEEPPVSEGLGSRRRRTAPVRYKDDEEQEEPSTPQKPVVHVTRTGRVSSLKVDTRELLGKRARRSTQLSDPVQPPVTPQDTIEAEEKKAVSSPMKTPSKKRRNALLLLGKENESEDLKKSEANTVKKGVVKGPEEKGKRRRRVTEPALSVSTPAAEPARKRKLPKRVSKSPRVTKKPVKVDAEQPAEVEQTEQVVETPQATPVTSSTQKKPTKKKRGWWLKGRQKKKTLNDLPTQSPVEQDTEVIAVDDKQETTTVEHQVEKSPEKSVIPDIGINTEIEKEPEVVTKPDENEEDKVVIEEKEEKLPEEKKEEEKAVEETNEEVINELEKKEEEEHDQELKEEKVVKERRVLSDDSDSSDDSRPPRSDHSRSPSPRHSSADDDDEDEDVGMSKICNGLPPPPLPSIPLAAAEVPVVENEPVIITQEKKVAEEKKIVPPEEAKVEVSQTKDSVPPQTVSLKEMEAPIVIDEESCDVGKKTQQKEEIVKPVEEKKEEKRQVAPPIKPTVEVDLTQDDSVSSPPQENKETHLENRETRPERVEVRHEVKETRVESKEVIPENPIRVDMREVSREPKLDMREIRPENKEIRIESREPRPEPRVDTRDIRMMESRERIMEKEMYRDQVMKIKEGVKERKSPMEDKRVMEESMKHDMGVYGGEMHGVHYGGCDVDMTHQMMENQMEMSAQGMYPDCAQQGVHMSAARHMHMPSSSAHMVHYHQQQQQQQQQAKARKQSRALASPQPQPHYHQPNYPTAYMLHRPPAQRLPACSNFYQQPPGSLAKLQQLTNGLDTPPPPYKLYQQAPAPRTSQSPLIPPQYNPASFNGYRPATQQPPSPAPPYIPNNFMNPSQMMNVQPQYPQDPQQNPPVYTTYGYLNGGLMQPLNSSMRR